MNRRKFLRNISFASTGLLILPSGNRVWTPTYNYVKMEFFSCSRIDSD